MERYPKIWRAFFAVSLIAIAVQQLVCGGFRPVIVPPSQHFDGYMVCVWITSVVLVLASAAIILNLHARLIAVYLGLLFLIFLVIFHIPYQVDVDLHFLGGWGDAFKMLAYSGGAFVVADSITDAPITKLELLLPAGRFMFAITMVVFGIEHFVYAPFVAMLVPSWLPGHILWTYLAGAALIAAGLGIMLDIKLRLAANLLGVIIFFWLITLHIPRAIADPHSGDGNEWTSVFEALGFSGTAFLIAANHKGRDYI